MISKRNYELSASAEHKNARLGKMEGGDHEWKTVANSCRLLFVKAKNSNFILNMLEHYQRISDM